MDTDFHEIHMIGGYGFLRRKLKNSVQYPISHKKGRIQFCHPVPLSLENSNASQKLFFNVVLKNIVLFEKKFLMKNIQNLISTKKGYGARCTLSLKTVMSSHK